MSTSSIQFGCQLVIEASCLNLAMSLHADAPLLLALNGLCDWFIQNRDVNTTMDESTLQDMPSKTMTRTNLNLQIQWYIGQSKSHTLLKFPSYRLFPEPNTP